MLANIEQAYQLSPMQKDLLAQIETVPYPATPVIQIRCRFSGDLDSARLERAWQHVVARHSMLRTSFCRQQPIEPLQVVHRQVPLRLTAADLRQLSPAAAEAQIATYCRDDLAHSFDPECAPLLRLMLFQQRDGYLLIWSVHPLLLDKIAYLHVLDDVFMYYDVLCQGYEPLLQSSLPYQQYVSRIQQRRQPIEQFWRSRLRGARPTSLLRQRSPRRISTARPISTSQRMTVSGETAAALGRWTRQHHVTLETLAHGAWAILLSRYSVTADVLFGTTLSQQYGASAPVVGLCSATVPLRVETPSSAVLWPWLRQLQTQLLEVRQHRYVAQSELRRWHGYEAGQPLFESAVLFENSQSEPSPVPWCKNLDLHEVTASRALACPLTLILEQGRDLALELVFDPFSFDERLIAHLLDDLLLLFQQIAVDPYQRLADLLLYHEPHVPQSIAA